MEKEEVNVIQVIQLLQAKEEEEVEEGIRGLGFLAEVVMRLLVEGLVQEMHKVLL